MRHADHEGDGAGPVVRPAPVSEAAGRSSVGGAAGLRLFLIGGPSYCPAGQSARPYIYASPRLVANVLICRGQGRSVALGAEPYTRSGRVVPLDWVWLADRAAQACAWPMEGSAELVGLTRS